MSITSFRCLYYSLSTDFKDITAFFLLLTLNKEMLLSFVNNNAVKIKWLNILCLWTGSRRIPLQEFHQPIPPDQIFPWWVPPVNYPTGEFLTRGFDRGEPTRGEFD